VILSFYGVSGVHSNPWSNFLVRSLNSVLSRCFPPLLPFVVEIFTMFLLFSLFSRLKILPSSILHFLIFRIP